MAQGGRRPRLQRLLVVAVLMPLWAQLPRQGLRLAGMLGRGRVLDWALHRSACTPRATALTAIDPHAGLPVAAVHDPADLRRPGAVARLAARGVGPTSGRAAVTHPCGAVVLPLIVPGDRRRLDLHVLAVSLGDYIAVKIVGGATQMLGNVGLRQLRRRQQPAVRGGGRDRPGRDHGRLPGRRPPHRRPGEPVRASMNLSRAAPRLLLAAVTALVAGVRLRAAGPGRASTRSTPTRRSPGRRRASPLHWWRARSHTPGARDALWTSVKVGLGATAIALVLGTLARASPCSATTFFGRDDGLAAGHPADRAARHRHRHRAEQRVPDGAAAARHQLGLFTIVVGARDVLHRRSVFNNVHGPAAPASARIARGGLRRPRRRPVHDLPAGHLPAAALGAARRRPARVRPVASTRSS